MRKNQMVNTAVTLAFLLVLGGTAYASSQENAYVLDNKELMAEASAPEGIELPKFYESDDIETPEEENILSETEDIGILETDTVEQPSKNSFESKSSSGSGNDANKPSGNNSVSKPSSGSGNTANKPSGNNSASKPSSGSGNTTSKPSGNTPSEPQKPSKPVHTHSWEAVTKIVHHDEVGHNEQVLVSAAWTEYVPVYETVCLTICNTCGADITGNTIEHPKKHVLAGENGSYRTEYEQRVVGTDVIEHPAEYKTQWVVDKAAYDETVVTGYKCSCGATK